VAAPVFREVAMTALRMLDVPKDLPGEDSRISHGKSDVNDLSIAELGEPPADLQDGSARVASSGNVTPRDVTARDATPKDVKPRDVSSVTPPPVQEEALASVRESSQDRRPFFAKQLGGAETPDFRGMTVRAVLAESAARGFDVERVGTGLARSQQPPPGTPLPPHALVRVQFGK
jgi:hypothetical protein